MWKLIILAIGVYAAFEGFGKIGVNSTPVEANIADIEKGDYSKYDYFKISGGQTLDIVYYTQSVKTKNIDEVVYPIFSQGLIDTLSAKFIVSKDFERDGIDGFSKWLMKNPVKPKVFVKSSLKDLKIGALKKAMESFDNKQINGVRLTKMEDIGDLIKDEMTKDGFDAKNAIIVAEGTNPVDSKKEGWFMFLGGIFIALFMVIWMFKGKVKTSIA